MKPGRLTCKWSLGYNSIPQGNLFFASENRGVSSQMCSAEQLPLLITVNVMQSVGPGGTHSFLSLHPSLLHHTTCKLTNNNMTNYLQACVAFSATGNVQFYFVVVFNQLDVMCCFFPIGLSLLIFF